MKKLFFFILFLIIFLPILTVRADPPVLGIETNTGSRIQIYTQQVVTNATEFTYYPQATNELGFDDFYIWISFPVIQNTQGQLIVNTIPANITLTMYGAETRITTYKDNVTGDTVYKNITEYTKLLSSKPFSVTAGQNEKGDHSYGILHIDKSVWDVLAPSDAKTKILVAYNDKVITIYHKTDYSLVPITQTRGEFNSQFYTLFIMYTFFLHVGLLIMMFIIDKNGQHSPPISLGWVMAIVGFVVAIYIYISFTSTAQNDALYNTAGLTPQTVLFILATVESFIIPAMFRNKQFDEIHILAMKVPFKDTKDVLNKAMRVADVKQIEKEAKGKLISIYAYKTLRNRTVFTKDKDSFWQWWVDFIFGGVKFNAEEATKINLMDDDWKKYVGFIYFTFEYKENNHSFIPEKLQVPAYIGLAVVNILLIVTIIQFQVSILLGAVVLALSGASIYIDHNMQRQGITIDPMTQTGVASLTNGNIADISQKKYDRIYTEISDLKINMKNDIADAYNAGRFDMYAEYVEGYINQTDFNDNLKSRIKQLNAIGMVRDPVTDKIYRTQEKEEEEEEKESKPPEEPTKDDKKK